jgi:uncharacterized SAM-binding protein YcdF (DUF218 family)
MFAQWSKTVFVSLVVLFTLLFLFRRPLLVAMGRWLVAQTPVEEVDLVVALGGDPSRQEAAVRYLNSGLARRILMTASNTASDNTRTKGNDFWNIPDGKTLTIANSAHNTYEEALRVRSVLNEHAFRSVLIVTSAYHLRRARLAFERLFRNTGVRLMFAAAPKAGFPMESWWKSEGTRKVVLREYLALGYYWIVRRQA